MSNQLKNSQTLVEAMPGYSVEKSYDEKSLEWHMMMQRRQAATDKKILEVMLSRNSLQYEDKPQESNYIPCCMIP